MSSKFSKKSKVSVNNYMSSEDENESDLDSNEETNDRSEDSLDDMKANEDDRNGGNSSGNKSWADAINKVLNTNPKNKLILLSKAKKDKDIGKTQKSDELDNDLEMVASDGTIVKRNQTINHNKSQTDQSVNKSKKLSKNEWELIAKLKPNLNDKERERFLASIATKGVVQLFNAVREQQQSIQNKMKEMGSSETKRDKALSHFTKTQFLDKLKNRKPDNDNNNNNKKKSQKTENKLNAKSLEDQKWKVLRDDFMIGAKMKDWDKDSDSGDSDD